MRIHLARFTKHAARTVVACGVIALAACGDGSAPAANSSNPPPPRPARPENTVEAQATRSGSPAAARSSPAAQKPFDMSGLQAARVVQDSAPVYVEPDATATIVTAARKGDVFYLLGERNGFYIIRLVSGRERFIDRVCCERTRFSVEGYTDTTNWRAYHGAIVKSQVRAAKEAPEGEPRDLLEDRYGMDVMHEIGLPAPLWGRIKSHALTKGWLMW